MLKNPFIIALLFIISIFENHEAQSKISDSVEQWKNDIDFLAETLKQVHPSFNKCGLPPEIDTAKDSLKNKIDFLTDEQIVVEIQKLLASAGDGHTLLFPFGMRRGKLLRVPLMLWIFEDGLFVIDAVEKEFIGKKVIGIGKMNTAEVLDKIKVYISHDNKQQALWAAPFYCTLTDFLIAVGAEQKRDSVTFVFEKNLSHTFTASSIDPEQLEIKLKPATINKPSKYLLRGKEIFWTEEINPDIIYVALNAMNDSQEMKLEVFGKELRTQLKSYTKMILDLRLNNGGEALKADELFKTCVAFDVNGGQIAVLIGRMTFSAAQTFTARLDQWTKAFFVGEATGSKPNHYGNERMFKLPFSWLRGTISSGYNQPVTINDKRTSIMPDVSVPVNSTQFFSGQDPELEAAVMELLRGK